MVHATCWIAIRQRFRIAATGGNAEQPGPGIARRENDRVVGGPGRSARHTCEPAEDDRRPTSQRNLLEAVQREKSYPATIWRHEWCASRADGRHANESLIIEAI